MARQRKTWKQAEQDKTASPPPQMPAVDRTEGPSHPAYHKDPEADQYEKGDPSAWAEDPHKPMSPESPPPAMPGNLTTDKLTHPATSPFQKAPESAAAAEGGKKQASLTEMAEQRASLCIRIATALLPGATASVIEDKAFGMMDLDEAQLIATANTLKILAGEEEVEDEVEEVDFEIEGNKKAAVEITARLEKLESSMGKLVKAMTHFFGMEGDEDEMSDKELMAYLMADDMDGDGVDQNSPDYGYDDKKSGEDLAPAQSPEAPVVKVEDEEDGEEEAMLKAMLEEMDEEISMKSASAVDDATKPLAKGQGIQSGEGGNTNPEEYAPTPVVAQPDGKDKVGDPTPHGKKADKNAATDNDIEITAGADPMGLMSDKEASADDELMQLYADLDLPKAAAKKGGEEEEEVEEEAVEEPADADAGTDESAETDDVEFGADDEEKKGGKKAALNLKPQVRTASQGVQRLGAVGGQTKTAASNEMDQLSKLWEHAPDVSSVFGVTPTR